MSICSRWLRLRSRWSMRSGVVAQARPRFRKKDLRSLNPLKAAGDESKLAFGGARSEADGRDWRRQERLDSAPAGSTTTAASVGSSTRVRGEGRIRKDPESVAC